MNKFFQQYLETARIDKASMKPDDFIAIRKIAEEARDKIQKYFKERDEDFWFAVTSDNLRGACAIASFFLQRKLKQAGYNSRVQCVDMRVGSHCFVIIEGNKNRHILDVTATQFGREFPKIVIRKATQNSKKYKDVHYQGYGVPVNVKGSDEDWINKNWMKDQTPEGHKELFK